MHINESDIDVRRKDTNEDNIKIKQGKKERKTNHEAVLVRALLQRAELRHLHCVAARPTAGSITTLALRCEARGRVQLEDLAQRLLVRPAIAQQRRTLPRRITHHAAENKNVSSGDITMNININSSISSSSSGSGSSGSSSA